MTKPLGNPWKNCGIFHEFSMANPLGVDACGFHEFLPLHNFHGIIMASPVKIFREFSMAKPLRNPWKTRGIFLQGLP